MTNALRRSRSNTSISTKSTHRPLSRASTTSGVSYDHQHDPSPTAQSQFQQHSAPQAQIYQHPQSQQYAPAYQPIESALLQAAQHASERDSLPLDPVHQLANYNAQASAPPVQHNIMPNAPQQPFDYPQAAQMLQVATNAPIQPVAGAYDVEDKKKKGSASGSATNDRELREMLINNEGRALKDVAAEVIATDRTSKAEKSKQLFAMLWLKSVCRIAKTSVPRNRVYSKYAARCGNERVIPLNPASFGKLVRVIFPRIQTRRLGVRGESKYHYVDLALIDDSQESDEIEQKLRAGSVSNPPKRQHSVSAPIDFNSIPRQPADTAAFPSHEQFESQGNYFQPAPSNKGRLFADIYTEGFHSVQSTSSSYEYELKFPSPEQLSLEENMDITPPDILPYLPLKTDPDAAEALVALYRTHCTSLVDSVRYCKERQFFRLFTSFPGTLTVPVQKLFAQPEIAPWIRECDWMMYQKMIRSVAQLTLQVAPPPVLKFLDTISKDLHLHIRKVFQGIPLHTLEARLEPATLFAHLLRQMLRVNSTAHAAAVLLLGDHNRDQMWGDFKTLVNVKRIMENELPDCGREEVYTILTEEIRGLLLPLGTWLPDGSYQHEPLPSADANITNETVIDRIATFLTTLPARFPNAPARTILHCINALGSAALREIIIENGVSFQGWWLTKVFIDEMGHWLASLGGFLDHSPPNLSDLSFSPGVLGGSMNAAMANGSGSNHESRYSSMDVEFGPNQNFMTAGNAHARETGNNTDGNNRKFHEQFDNMSFNLDLEFANSQPDQTHDDSAIDLLNDGLDSKFTSTMQQSLKSHLTQLSAGVS